MTPPTRLHYVPIAVFFFFPFTFFLCYFIALSLDHINAFFAFISDAGTVPPEQNVFAQLLNMGALLFAYFAYIRFKQVEQYFRLRYNKPMCYSNVIGMVIGMISTLGVSMVGNFPLLQEKHTHFFGAFLAFAGGSVYIVFQGYLSFKLLPHFQSKSIAYMRTFLGILGIMLYLGANFTAITSQLVAKSEGGRGGPSTDVSNKLKWNPDEPGYSFHAASVTMEWLLVVIFVSFIITFTPEFKKFKMIEPEIKFFIDVTALPEPEDMASNNNTGESETTIGESERQVGVHPQDSDLAISTRNSGHNQVTVVRV